MDEGRLAKTHTGRDVPSHPEIGVLIDRTWDEARHIQGPLEGDCERAGEGRTCLYGREGTLADIVRGGESEDRSYLVVRGEFLNAQDGWVHVLDVVQIGENESLFHVESTCDDVLGIFVSESGMGWWGWWVERNTVGV